MINDQNYQYCLRCLVKIAEKRPLRYEEIPQEFIKRFTLPGISQAINISINNRPEIDYDKVENYLKDKTFSNFDELVAAIKTNFQSDYEKLYACFYFTAHHIEYDYERKCTVNKKPLSIQTIFETKKGVCSDYSMFFRELAFCSGYNTNEIQILPFINASKGNDRDSYYQQSEPNYEHEANYIKIKDQIYLSEPTWGAGSSDDNNQFTFDYNKSNFLIPYYKGITDHFPNEKFNESINKNFTWDRFKNIYKPNLKKELCFESNILQEITVEDGFYEMQFSFIQPVETVYGKVFYFEDNDWHEQDKRYISYECLEKNLPSINFSYSKQLRCRYKLIISFPKEGKYYVKTFVNDDPKTEGSPLLFTSYFNVKRPTDKLIGIPGSLKERFGFIPIVPREGLTQITNGFARIRFAVKLSRSNISMYLYENSDDKNELDVYENNLLINSFTTNLPFNYDSEDLNDPIVEDWLLLKFPKDGSFKVEIKFVTEDNKFIEYGVTYYFDVTGTQKENIIYPFFDLPNNRTFFPLKFDKQEEIHIYPSEKIIIQESGKFHFHILSEKKYDVFFTEWNTSAHEQSVPHLIEEKNTGNGNIIDRRYSSPELTKGYYKLFIAEVGEQSFAHQDYFILGSKWPKESPEEKILMKDLKALLEGKFDHLNDIPSYIREKVEKMVADSIKALNTNDGVNAEIPSIRDESSGLESEEEKTKLKMKIINLEKRSNKLEIENDKLSQKVTEIAKQKEDQEKRALSLEQEKNEISNKMKELMEQIESLNNKTTKNDEGKVEMFTKLNELEQRKQELEKRASSLEQENNELNNRFNELSKQKEKQEKQALILEQEQNKLSNKVNELEKQKEELIESIAKEKSITDSKIHELEEQIQKHEKHALSLEQEKSKINEKLEGLIQQKEDENSKSNKEEMIAKLKELQNQIDLLEKEKKLMGNQINELLEQKEKQDNYSHSLEVKNKEINQQLEQLLKQKEDINNKSFKQEQERNEMVTKLRELEQRKKELEDKASSLEQEKDDLNNKFKKLVKQKEEIERSAKKLENERNELNNKVVELVKQKEEINKNMANEKSIADSKILSYDSKIKELMNQIEEQENYAKKLENEIKNFKKQVIEFDKQKVEIISREEKSKNQQPKKSEIQEDRNNTKMKSNQEEIGPTRAIKKYNQTEVKPTQIKRKSDETEVEPTQIKRKSDETEVEPTQIKRKSDETEVGPTQIKRKSDETEVEPIQSKRKPDQEEVELIQTRRKSNKTEVGPTQIKRKSDEIEVEPIQSKSKPDQEEVEPIQTRRKSNKTEVGPTQTRRKSDQTEIEPTQTRRKPDQEEVEPTQIKRKSDQTEIEPTQSKRKSDHTEVEPIQARRKSDKTEDDDNINQSEGNMLQILEDVKHETMNESKIEEPKPNPEGNSPRKKVKWLYDPSLIDQILPGTPPKRIHKCKRPIKLTVTLKDIGMENFDQPYNGLPAIINNKNIINSQNNKKYSSGDGGTELPRLFMHKKNAKISVQTQDQITQTQKIKIQKSPRRKKEHSYNYDPNIFYTPICPESPVGPVRYFKDPVKLTVTLKDIGMDKFDSQSNTFCQSYKA